MKLTKNNIIVLSAIAVVLIAVILIAVFFTKPILSYKAVMAYKYDIWSDIECIGEVDESVSKEINVTFNGTTYIGEYYKTVGKPPYTYAIHRYMGEEANFEINAETGEIVYISFDGPLPEKCTVDEDYCKKVADNLADNYINLKRYKVDSNISETGSKLFTFDYYIEKGGYKTADALRIVLDGNGNIKLFRKYMLGSFGNVLYVKKPNEKRVEKAFDELLVDLRESNPKVRYEWERDKVILIKDPDGKIAYLYDAVLNKYTMSTLEDGTEAEFVSSEALQVVLY